MVKYPKSALVAISFILFFSISLFLYSCGQNNPTGSGSSKSGITGPSGLTTPIMQKAYVSGMMIPVIDLKTNTVIKNIDLWGGFAAGIATNPKTNMVYVSDINNDRLVVINASWDFIMSMFPVGKGPHGVAVNTTTNAVYVANSTDNTVSVIDGTTNSVVATIPVGTKPIRLAVDNIKNSAFVTNFTGNSVSIVSGNTYKVSKTITLSGAPLDVAVDPSIDQAYITTPNSVIVVDTATEIIKATISASASLNGATLNRVAVNTVTHQVYVSTLIAPPQTTNQVVVIDGLTNNVVGVTNGKRSVSYIGLDSMTNMLYLNQWGYFGDAWTHTMSGDHTVDVADLSNIIPSPILQIPSNLNIVATMIFSWKTSILGIMNLNLVDGDIAVFDNNPTPLYTPPSKTPPPPPPVTGLAITPVKATIYIHPQTPSNGSQQYTAMDDKGNNVTNSASWQSDKPNIATLNITGLATPPQPLSMATPGIAMITARANGITSNIAELCVDCWEFTHYRQNIDPWRNEPLGMNWDRSDIPTCPIGSPRNIAYLEAVGKLNAPEYGGTITWIYRRGIGGRGCYMTSWAMALTAATGTPITPSKLNQDLQNNDGYDNNNAPKWLKIKELYPNANIDTVISTSNPDVMLQNCDMIILGLGKSGPFQSTLPSTRLHPVDHYVLLVKKQNGKYKIYDPWLMRDNNSGIVLDNEIQLDDLDDLKRELLTGTLTYTGIKFIKY